MDTGKIRVLRQHLLELVNRLRIFLLLNMALRAQRQDVYRILIQIAQLVDGLQGG